MQTVSDVFHKIYPTLEKMEAKRKKLLRQSENIFFICFGMVSLIGIFSFLLGIEQFQVPLIAIGVIVLIGGWISDSNSRSLKRKYKTEVINSIISSIDPSFRYNSTGTISSHKFNDSRLFSEPDRYSGEDYITGRIGKTDFELAEILAKDEHTDSEGDTSYTTVFRGLFMIADFHKDFQGHTIVVPDDMGEGWFGRNFKSSWKSNMERAKMENTDFENEFDVYTTDQVEARYILSISMLENIFKLKQVFQNDVFIAFHASCIYIGISQWRASFLEPNLKKSLLLESTIHGYLDEIWQILDIIEELNLNTRIWSKQ